MIEPWQIFIRNIGSPAFAVPVVMKTPEQLSDFIGCVIQISLCLSGVGCNYCS